LMRLRKKKRLAEVSYEGLQSPDAVDFLWGDADRKSERGDDIAQSKELRGQIAMAIEGLEPKYKNVFVAKEVEGLSLQEIADEMDLSIPAVKSRLHRARLSLRVSLERYVEG